MGDVPLYARLNRRMVVADSAYGTYVDFVIVQAEAGCRLS